MLELPERHHRRGVLRGVAGAGERAARLRHRGPDRGGGLLVRLRPRGRHRRDHVVRRDGERRSRRGRRRPAGSMPSRPTPRARRSAPGGRSSRAPGMSWDDTLGNLRVLDKWRADAGLNYGIERPEARPRTLARHAAGAPRRADPAASRSAGLGEVGLGAGARLRGLPRLRQRLDPARRLLREGRQRLRHRLGLRHAAAPSACSASGCGRAACATRSSSIGKGAHSPLTYPDVIAQAARRDASSGSAPTTSTSISCTATTPTCRSASSSTPWTPRCGRAHPRPVRRLELDPRAARRRDRLRRSRRARPSPRRSPTTSRSPRWSTRSGPAASPASDAAWRGLADRAAADQLRLVEPGARLLHRRRRPRQARQCRDRPRLVLRGELRPPRPRGRAGRASAASARSTSRSPMCLAQPFPVVPLIGPRRLVELDDSLRALELGLTPEDVRWLVSGVR